MLQVVRGAPEAGGWLKLRAAMLSNLGYYFRARGTRSKLETALKCAASLAHAVPAGQK